MADSYLSRFGETLVRNGYAVIPIVAGTKRPPGWMSHEKGDPWSAVKPDLARVSRWREEKRLAGAGVGINLGRTLFAIDIDILDPAMVEEVLDWCEWNLPGNPPQRIGLAPKTLLLFRTETAIRKVASSEFVDGQGRKAQIEGLGEGEQFVAYAIHPDTKKPYEWPGADPIEVKAADLPPITLQQVKSLIEWFEGRCKALGWEVKRRGSAALATTGDDDWTQNIDPGVATNLSPEELRKAVFTLPNDGLDNAEADFDTWLAVGMAVFHQTEGSQDGLDLWCEWSALSSKHVQAECERRWRSFDVTDKDRRPLTARWLLKEARKLRDEKVTKQVEDLRASIEKAGSEDAIHAVAKQAKTIELDRAEREIIATLLQKRLKAVLGASVPIGIIRDMIRFEASIDKPKWLIPWVYVSGENVFYNRVSQVVMKPEAFDATFARNLLTDQDRREGKTHPDRRPSDMALNVFQIPAVDRRLYLPKEEQAATDKFRSGSMLDGQTYVNTYTRASIPEIPLQPTDQNRADLRTVQEHCEWLIPEDRERHLVLSWLAHPVQTRGRSRWALVLLGEEGSGKTFFFEMMGYVLGRQNVRTVGPKEIEKEFNGWMEGVQLVCFEEIKQHGHNRYDVLNSLKPIITNDYVSVRRMRVDSYMIPNTASIMAYTNFADALPISEGDRRYMMVATAPRKADIEAKGAAYFNELFAAMARSPGMIHEWLLKMDLHPDFNPDGRAPMTTWKRQAIALTERPEVTMIRGILEEDGGVTPGLSPVLLSTRVLSDRIADIGEAVPQTHALNRALMDIGLRFVGRVKVNGEPVRFWSNNPAGWWDRAGEPLTSAIRGWMNPDL